MKTEFLYRCFRNESQVISSINCLSHLLDNFEPDFSHVSLKLILSLKFENFGLVQFSTDLSNQVFMFCFFWHIFC